MLLPFVRPDISRIELKKPNLYVIFLKDPSKNVLSVVGREGMGKTSLICRVLEYVEKGTLPDTEEPFLCQGESSIKAPPIPIP